jgi:hypothetical protein
MIRWSAGAPLSLVPHPSTPPAEVNAVTVTIDPGDDRSTLKLQWHVAGAPALLIPPLATGQRADELWRTTCFELFIRESGQESYIEQNFSPSRAWAAYRFNAYRAGMARADVAAPRIRSAVKGDSFLLSVTADLGCPAQDCHLGLTAVIEEVDGTKSYWAVAHPSEGPPDFHHPDCFALTLAAPQRT